MNRTNNLASQSAPPQKDTSAQEEPTSKNPWQVCIKVPATSANVGPGFDCLGLALNLFASFTLQVSDSLVIDGCPAQFCGHDNLVWTSYLAACKELICKPVPLHITINSPIPLSGGLGSSSTCVVAGVLAAFALNNKLDEDKNRTRALDICTLIEGHPDNVAPALLGGLVSTYNDGRHTHTLTYPLADNLRFVAIAPPYEVRTSDARKVMPQNVSLDTAIWQIGHAVATVHALQTGNAQELKHALIDKLHEPYRAELIRDYEPLQRTALAAGAQSFIISGSGSTMLAICTSDEAAQNVVHAICNMEEFLVKDLWLCILKGSTTGAVIEP